jgi:hypothetical protein
VQYARFNMIYLSVGQRIGPRVMANFFDCPPSLQELPNRRNAVLVSR